MRRGKFVFNFRERLSVPRIEFRVYRPRGAAACRLADESTETGTRHFEVKGKLATRGTFWWQIDDRDRSDRRVTNSTRHFENSNFDAGNRTTDYARVD